MTGSIARRRLQADALITLDEIRHRGEGVATLAPVEALS
jgi:hypothetical protein